MNPRIWFSALALSSFCLASWAQSCGLRDNGDGTMTDPVSGLQIQKCPVGQSWASKTCTGNPRYIKWSDAVQQFEQGEWRLITKEEAEKVGARSANCGSPEWGLGLTWTSSPDVTEPRGAWVYGMSNGGNVSVGGRINAVSVHLVRAGQTASRTNASVVCAAEIQQAIERQLDNHRRVSPGHEAYHLKQQQDYWFQIDNQIKGGTVESLNASLKYQISSGELLREKYRSDPNYQLNLAGNAAQLCLLNFYLNPKSNQNSKVTQYSNMPGQSPQGQQNQARIDQQSQQVQQLAQQAQQSAQQNQSRADQERQGKRKTHDPAAEAHECISIDKAGSGNYGAFKNQCPYPVNFYSCNEKPRVIQGGFNWSADFDCAKQQLGLYTPKANSSVAAHNRNTEFVHWFACKAPAMPVDATYAAGKGIEARCHN